MTLTDFEIKETDDPSIYLIKYAVSGDNGCSTSFPVSKEDIDLMRQILDHYCYAEVRRKIDLGEIWGLLPLVKKHDPEWCDLITGFKILFEERKAHTYLFEVPKSICQGDQFRLNYTMDLV